jgi:DNA-binding GntR family transcriptional regulator
VHLLAQPRKIEAMPTYHTTIAGRAAGEDAPGDAGGYALPELMTVEPERRRVASLAEKAYYLLRDKIITLQLPPGSTIDERALQQELDLGRTPIREALHRLADESFVRVIPRRGMFVAGVEAGDLGAISELRVELEGFAGRLGAERASPGERAAAEDLRKEVATTAEGGVNGNASADHLDHLELMRLDQRIHRLVHRGTRNPYLQSTCESYFVHSLRLWFLGLDRITRLDEAVAEHLDVLAAVRDGDADTAERVLRAHVAGFEREIRAVL